MVHPDWRIKSGEEFLLLEVGIKTTLGIVLQKYICLLGIEVNFWLFYMFMFLDSVM